MDKTVNILILIIVFVFDPLAICLVLAANFAFGKAFPKKRENIYGEKVVITPSPIVESEVDPDDLPDLGEKKTNSIDVEIEKINVQIENIRNSNLSAFRQNKKVDTLNEQKQNLLNKEKNKEDDDLTIIY
jgi:hypothetical protein